VQLRLSDKVHKIPTHFSLGSASHSDSIRQKPLNVQKLIRAASRTAALEQASKQTDTDFKACRITGSFEANKLSGNMHITAVGHGYDGAHLDHHVMNMTHKIDELSFGELYPTIVNPLDDSFEISESAFEAFQYFLIVVPTIYVDRSKSSLLTNQYSVSEYRRTFGDDQGVPGLFFKYEFEPMTLMISEESSMSFGHLLVRLAGLVGGYYVTAGMAYKVLSAVYFAFRPEQAPLRRHNV
ncbi:endoplasmic reticulum vesicle transporter-domain-containing protein, partial [Dissophora ornata]